MVDWWWFRAHWSVTIVLSSSALCNFLSLLSSSWLCCWTAARLSATAAILTIFLFQRHKQQWQNLLFIAPCAYVVAKTFGIFVKIASKQKDLPTGKLALQTNQKSKTLIQFNSSIIHSGSLQAENSQNHFSREVITPFWPEAGRSVSFSLCWQH